VPRADHGQQLAVRVPLAQLDPAVGGDTRQTPSRSSTASATLTGSGAPTAASALARVSSPLTSRLIGTTSAVAWSTSSCTSGSSTPSAMLSSDNRSAVSGVRSWCDASAMNARCARTNVSIVSVALFIPEAPD